MSVSVQPILHSSFLKNSSHLISSFFDYLPILIGFNKRTIFFSLFEETFETVTVFIDLYALSFFQTIYETPLYCIPATVFREP